MDAAIRHPEPGAVIEVSQVETEGPVFLDVDEVLPDGVGVPWLPVGRQTHQFVFPRIDLESRVKGECRVQQTQ